MFFSAPRPRVLAHRGFIASDNRHERSLATENTLEAFAAAVDLGAHYIETDAHATRDRVAVLVHDPAFVDQSGRTHRVADLTFAQLSEIPLPCGSRVPSLAEALELFPETRFNIDVKEQDAVDPVAGAIQATESYNRVLVTSFSSARRKGVLAQVPGTFSGAGRNDVIRVLLLALTRQDESLQEQSRFIQAVQLPGNSLGKRVLTERVIARIQRASIEVHVWTVNEEAEMKFWLSRGVDGLVTDQTELALRVVREANAR